MTVHPKPPDGYVYVPIYELRPDERCAGCGGEIHPTGYGQFTMMVVHTATNKAYHGDCVPRPA